MTTHISYECAKKLKDFLGDSAPEPIKGERYGIERSHPYISFDVVLHKIPAYQLHDLLSPAFCEAMVLKLKSDYPGYNVPMELQGELSIEYWGGGLPAVEKSLEQMIKEAE